MPTSDIPIPSVLAGWFIRGDGGPISGRVRMDLRDGRVIRTVPLPSGGDLPSDALDLLHCTILPGLIDAHLHLFMSGTANETIRKRQLDMDFEEARPVIESHLKQLRSHGIVAVRDGGDGHGHALRYKVSRSTPPSPEIRVAGRAFRREGRYGRLIGGPPGNGRSLADAIRRVDGPVDHIKIVNSGINSLIEFGKQTPPQFDLGEMSDAAAAAHGRGLSVMVHANGPEPVRIALEAGCDSVEHGFFMGNENLKRMADMGTVWVPTACTMSAYADQLPRGSRESEVARRTLEHQLEQLRLARMWGVRVALGTDAGSLGVHHGAGVALELKLLVAAGFSMEEAVQCAGTTAADLLGAADLGRLIPGCRASFIAVPGGPTALPEGLRRPEAVFMDGHPLEGRSRTTPPPPP